MTVKAYGEMTNSLAMRERERKLVELQSPTAAKATSSFVVAGTSSHVANPFASSAVSSSSANANAVTKPFQQTSSAGLFVAAANVAEGYDVVPLPQAYPKLSGSSAVLLVFGMLLLWFELTLACFSQTDVFTQIRYIAQSMKKTATSATSSAFSGTERLGRQQVRFVLRHHRRDYCSGGRYNNARGRRAKRGEPGTGNSTRGRGGVRRRHCRRGSNWVLEAQAPGEDENLQSQGCGGRVHCGNGTVGVTAVAFFAK
ncbi:unnamed protein product [Amoebophrya sp. A120]|nr:unnamed protein product [Amoebophrya sp. A120]|eukprot:GSA120T00010787001.1